MMKVLAERLPHTILGFFAPIMEYKAVLNYYGWHKRRLHIGKLKNKDTGAPCISLSISPVSLVTSSLY